MSALPSNGAEHLASLPAYVINLERSTKRRSLLRHAVEPFVGSMTIVPGVDGELLPLDDVLEFMQAALANPALSMRGDKGLPFWAGAMGVYLAHIEAITVGIESGGPFLVLEDDARFYRQDLAALTDVPDTDGVYVWGGALKGSSHTGPARAYAAWAGHINRWSKIVGEPTGRHGATALEFRSPDAALQYLSILADNPHAVDIAWWQAMRKMDLFIAEVEVIQQCPFLPTDRGGPNGRAKAAQLLLEAIIG